MDDKIVPFRPTRKRLHQNFRRAMAAEQVPIVAMTHDMMKIAPHGEPAHWVAILQVPTRNLSTCSQAEQERVLYHLMKFLNARTERFQWRFSSRPVDPGQILAEIDQRVAALPEHDDRQLWLLDMREHLLNLVRINSIPQAGLYLVLQVAAKGPKEDTDEIARKLQHLCTMAMSELHPVGLEAKRLGNWELLCLLWADLNPDLVAVHKTPASPRSLLTMSRPARFALVETTDYFEHDDPFTSRGRRAGSGIPQRPHGDQLCAPGGACRPGLAPLPPVQRPAPSDQLAPASRRQCPRDAGGQYRSTPVP
jgi:hypothetical protein